MIVNDIFGGFVNVKSGEKTEKKKKFVKKYNQVYQKYLIKYQECDKIFHVNICFTGVKIWILIKDLKRWSV